MKYEQMKRYNDLLDEGERGTLDWFVEARKLFKEQLPGMTTRKALKRAKEITRDGWNSTKELLILSDFLDMQGYIWDNYRGFIKNPYDD